MLPAALVTIAAVLLLLRGEALEHETTRRFAKPLASTGFVAAALMQGALGSDYGRLVLGALLLSWVGDVCLLSRRRAWFLAGLLAFLLAHVAFGVAFWRHGVHLGWTIGAAALLLGPLLVVRHWLRPYLTMQMRDPVGAYIVVITGMVALAIGATAAGGSVRIAAGALAFYLSDLAVARERFVHSELANRFWGLPLYYGAQLLLASTVAS